ncbi:MAG: UDP-3-O-(3-hydroxymyristoyl)glucosamine N-acyltransferase, partial [Hydrocarboniphaga effusa]|nr:UDP-3-O-(3-hydroxymyristoyl)glucosamine N-acyltransferase [Hydrocarboniphaga effusa]
MATLGELAGRFSLELKGDPALEIRGVCTLDPGEPGGLSFLANPRYRGQLAQTQAAAVILGQADARSFRGNALIAKDPYLAYARIAALFDPGDKFTAGVHPSAVIAEGVKIPATSHVGALCVVEQGAQVGAKVFIGPGCTIGPQARIGEGSRLEARVHVGERVQIGQRARIQPGAVIGSRGFGLARGPKGWEEVPQLGSVKLGDDVEVGANTTIDRGAIGDTVLEDGVKLDNQIQVAHNVRIGAHTEVAACVGIAGSTRIGARCMIGGGAGISGHLDIGDDVVILGWTMVTRSLPGPGQYGSGMPAQPAREWRRSIARLRRLGSLEQRLGAIEQKLGIKRSVSGD